MAGPGSPGSGIAGREQPHEAERLVLHCTSLLPGRGGAVHFSLQEHSVSRGQTVSSKSNDVWSARLANGGVDAAGCRTPMAECYRVAVCCRKYCWQLRRD